MCSMSKNLLKVLVEKTSPRAFPVGGLVEKIQEGYVSDQSNIQKPRKNFSPSSLAYMAGGGGCPRYWYFKFTGGYQSVESNPQALANMKNGTLSHGRIQDAIKKSGIAVDTEKKVINSDPPIFGFVDNIITWMGEELPVEIKTAREEAWQYRVKSDKAPDYHLVQLLIYMRLLDKKRGVLLYESKNTHALYAIPVEMTKEREEWLESAFDWMKTVKGAFDNKTLPTKPYRANSKVCKKCPFNKMCEEAGKGVVTIPPLRAVS